ncbi:hypothetical protein M407DRAFT_228447 [Tulasnella calospora MUT 4182]|uniref:Major facilitator superfamily (MFS) profile domain-containing protein n=1 Tax=Tulasnella calospora MUT 4182 TaxID=1051891 RepID=A0A0C3QPA4_9AGAM|nr:hypothetical protein M407DRAFT_228447 [Tulasnella calospora MUT 4182]
MVAEKMEAQGVGTPDRADSATLRSNTPVQNAEEKSEDPEKAAIAAVPLQDESKLVGGYKLVLIFIGMMLSALLVALDQTIVATAIPRIASEFNALDEVTWIASAYFLTQCGLTLTYGKLLAAVTTKWVYLFAVIIFEIGSAVCGAAPTVEALIIGRAIAGIGAAGIFVPSLFSPVDDSLPLGAITVATIILFIKPKHSTVEPAGFKETMRRIAGIDWIGSLLSIGMITSILLPLQWGGITKPWTDKTVIACFCVFAILLAAFLGWEWYVGEDQAIMPLSMWANRTQIGCCLEGCCIIAGGALSGAVIHVTGRPRLWLIVPPPLAALSCGLIFWKLQHTPSTGFLLGMQILLGTGCGCALQNCVIAIQAEYSKKPEMVPQSSALVNFTQYFGGTLGIAIAGTIFGNQLSKFIAIYAPGLSPETVAAVKQSVEMIKMLDPEVQAGVITAYSKALGYVFIIGIPSGILASLAGCLVPNFNIKEMSLQAGGAHAV